MSVMEKVLKIKFSLWGIALVIILYFVMKVNFKS